MNKTEFIAAIAENAGISKKDAEKAVKAYADVVKPAMDEARAVYDEMEPLIGEGYKPFPSYEDLLYRV